MSRYGKTGAQEWPRYYERDRGCRYSEGADCEHCPFIECVESLSRKDKQVFLRDWRKNKAVRWRRIMWQIKSAYSGSKELTLLLEQGWEPFAVSRGEVWIRKPPPEVEQEVVKDEEIVTESMAKVGYETMHEEKWGNLLVLSIERRVWLEIAKNMLVELRRLWAEVRIGETK